MAQYKHFLRCRNTLFGKETVLMYHNQRNEILRLLYSDRKLFSMKYPYSLDRLGTEKTKLVATSVQSWKTIVEN